MPPEASHRIVLRTLTIIRLLLPPARSSKYSHSNICGMQVLNRIGIAAGFDKTGAYIPALSFLKVGFIEIGTVTPYAQSGNIKPRLFRLRKDRALINRMGFNNAGVHQSIDYCTRYRKYYQGAIGINIGKSTTTSLDKAHEDYMMVLETSYQSFDFFTLNISSPNTENLRNLQTLDYFDPFCCKLMQVHSALSLNFRWKPIFLKISPDIDIKTAKHLATIACKYGITALIISNTTTDRHTLSKSRYIEENGGLSGQPLQQKALCLLQELRSDFQGKISFIASGGIMHADDAQARFNAGADAVQVYTGLIYHGPGLIKRIIKISQL